MHYAQLFTNLLSEAALMGWLDAALFVAALVAWIGGAPVWVPLVLLILAVILLCLLLGDADSVGEAIGEFLGSLW